MKVSILDSHTKKDVLHLYFEQIQSFLNDLTCDYPYFEEWLKKALSEIKLGKRQVVLLTQIENPLFIIGLTILKTEGNEKKICTVRVAHDHQRLGYGTELIKKSVEVLGTKAPLVTVSEKHIGVFKPFFRQFGFKVANRVKSLYHEGEYEYFFNVPYQHKNVLLSVKPQYANAIFEGRKKVEFRKLCFSKTVKRVYVYSSSPEKKILGYFLVETIEKDSPRRLWEKYGAKGSIEFKEYMEYFAGADEGYAILIREIRPFKYGVAIKDVFFGSYATPQNYRYVDNVRAIHRMNNAVDY